MANDIQKAKEPALVGQLKRMAPAIKDALPRHINPDRMSRIALTALRSTRGLIDTSPASFLGSIIQASQLGLEPNTPLGQCYLIPYKGECQLIIGYQGMLELARRSGLLESIYGMVVYEGDKFDYCYGTDPKITHHPMEQSDRLTHVYVVARLKGSSEPIFTVLSRAQIEKFRARSSAGNKGPWRSDYDAMALKTAVRRLFRWLPKSSEMASAASLDGMAESGKTQIGAWDSEVNEVLERSGHQLPEPEEDEGDIVADGAPNPFEEGNSDAVIS